MKRIIPFIISTLLGLFLFIFILAKIGVNSIFESLALLSPEFALIGLLIFLVMLVLQVKRWQLILKSLGYSVGFGKALIGKVSGFAISYLTPMSFFGGDPWQAYYLKKEKNIALHQGLSSIFIHKTIELLMGAVLIFISFLYLIIQPVSAQIIIVSILFMAAIVGGIVFFFNCAKSDKRFLWVVTKFLGLNKIKYIQERSDRIHRIEENLFSFFWVKRMACFKASVLVFCEALCSLVLFKIILISIGVDLSIFQLIFLRALTLMVSLVPIPAALGVAEGGNAFVFMLFGLGATFGVVFSLLVRCFYILEVVIGLIFLSNFGIKLSRALFSKLFIGNGSG